MQHGRRLPTATAGQLHPEFVRRDLVSLGAPDLEGQRARIAIDRYDTTTTVAPVTTTTSSVGGQ